MTLLWEAIVVLALILANGFFAAAEIAILVARRSRLEELAAKGSTAARRALDLARSPDRFLPTVQVGITLVGTLAAVFGGATAVGYLSRRLAASPLPLLADRAQTIAMAVVVVVIAFFSLVLGELMPKRVALAGAERLALVVASPLHLLATVARPVTWLLAAATELGLRLLGVGAAAEPAVSIEDIEHMIKVGTRTGVLAPGEPTVARRALRFGDRTVREIMRPRVEIDALEVDTPPDEVVGAVAMSGFSRVPIHEGDLDHIIGFVYTKDLLRQQHLHWPIELRKLVRPPVFVPESLPLDRLLKTFNEKRTQMAIVLDEYGGTEGLVTMEDVLEELVGEIHDEYRVDSEQEIVRRDEHSWLVDGALHLDDLVEATGVDRPPTAGTREFSTLGGLILNALGRLPKVGEQVRWGPLTLEVVDMDGLRIDRVLVSVEPNEA
jgi:putative hemolysin